MYFDIPSPTHDSNVILIRPLCFCLDDIPIQVTKEDPTGESKGNLVSITEEESTEASRVGSM